MFSGPGKVILLLTSTHSGQKRMKRVMNVTSLVQAMPRKYEKKIVNKELEKRPSDRYRHP